MKLMHDRVNRATKLISLWPWSYYIGDRHWTLAQRIANSDANIWPRTIVDRKPLHLANELAELLFRIQINQPRGNETMNYTNIAQVHLLREIESMLHRAKPSLICAIDLLVSKLNMQVLACLNNK